MDMLQQAKSYGKMWGNLLGVKGVKGVNGYKTGGTVKKTELALVHKNEFVLPAGVKPTKEQKAQIRKLKQKK